MRRRTGLRAHVTVVTSCRDEIDELQATVAGSLTWEAGPAGEALCADARDTSASLSIRAGYIGLRAAAARLAWLGEILDEATE